MATPTSTDHEFPTRFRDLVVQRWYLSVGGLVLTLALGVIAVILVPLSYTAKGAILIKPPRTAGVNGDPNPYLQLGGAQPTADVLAYLMTAIQTRNQLAAQGLRGTYTVTRDLSTDGPILDVAVTRTSAASALHDLRLVIALANPLMSQAQSSIPAASKAIAQTISSPTKASTVSKAQIRAVVVAVGVGLGLTVVVVVLFDAWALRRRSRAGPARSAEPGRLSDATASLRIRSSASVDDAVVWERWPRRDATSVVPDQRTVRSVESVGPGGRSAASVGASGRGLNPPSARRSRIRAGFHGPHPRVPSDGQLVDELSD